MKFYEYKEELQPQSSSVFPVNESPYSILRSTKQTVLSSTGYKEYINKSCKVKLHFQSPEKIKLPPIDSSSICVSRNENFNNVKSCTNATVNRIKYSTYDNSVNFINPFDNQVLKLKKIKNSVKDTLNIEDLYDKLSFIKKFSKDGRSLVKNINKESIISIITEKLKDLVSNGTENLTSSKSKIFYSNDNKINYKLEISIKSILIKIKENTSKFTNEMSAEVPFSLIPLFYYSNNSNFCLIISQILQFDADFSEVTLNMDKVNKVLKLFEEKLLNNEKLFEDSNLIKPNSNFYIDLITQNKIFQMMIILPSINLVIDDLNSEKKLVFKKQLPSSLCIQLYQSNFLRWDIITLDYLTEFKNFRDNVLYFTNNNSNKKFTREINYVELENLQNKFTGFNLSEQKRFDMIYVNDDKSNIFVSVEGYEVILNPNNIQLMPSIQTSLNNKIQFNIRQSVQLEKVGSIKPLDEFLEKCLVQKRNGKQKWAELDIQSIDNIDDYFLVYLFKSNIEKPVAEKDPTQSLFTINCPRFRCTSTLENKETNSSIIHTFNVDIPNRLFLKFENYEKSYPSNLIKPYMDEYTKNYSLKELKDSLNRSPSMKCQSPSPNKRSIVRRSTSTKLVI